MKAEHRKELETNTLADALGRGITNVRKASGIPWLTILLVAGLLLTIFIFFMYQRNKRQTNAELWMKLEANTLPKLQELGKDYADTKQGQAARFTLAHEYLWLGIKMMGDPNQSIKGLELALEAQKVYRELEEVCKDEPERLAEAKYGQAVVTETMAIFKADALEDAKKRFEEIGSGNLAGTAYGKLAKQRFEQYTNDFTRISTFYSEFSRRSGGGGFLNELLQGKDGK